MLPIISIGGIKIFTYPMMMGIAWATAFNVIKRNKNFSYLSFIGIFISSWVGAKILFLLTIPKHLENLLISNQLFWLGGGFVFYGGLLLALMWVVLVSKIEKKNLSEYQFYISGLLIGHGIGRIGCFLAGCCFGMSINGFQLPVQLIEAVLLIYLFLKSRKNEFNLINYLLIYSVFRFFVEFIRADQIRGEYAHLSTSQIISLLILIGLGLIKLFQVQKLK